MADKDDDLLGPLRSNLRTMLPITSGIFSTAAENPVEAAQLTALMSPDPVVGTAAGVAEAFGQYPDPFNPGQKLPSVLQQVREGEYLGAGLTSLGAIPVLGAGAGLIRRGRGLSSIESGGPPIGGGGTSSVSDLSVPETITSWLISPNKTGRENVVDRLAQDPSVQTRSLSALDDLGYGDTIPVFRLLNTKAEDLKGEQLISGTVKPEQVAANTNFMTEGKIDMFAEGGSDYVLVRYDVPRDKVQAYLPAFKQDIKRGVNKKVKEKGFGQDKVAGLETVTNPSEHAKKLLDLQDEILVDVTGLEPTIFRNSSGQPINILDQSMWSQVAKGEVKTADEFSQSLRSNEFVLPDTMERAMSGVPTEEIRKAENQARIDAFNTFNNFFRPSLDTRGKVPTRRELKEMDVRIGEARKRGDMDTADTLTTQRNDMQARFDEANPKQPKAEAAPVPINQAARGRIGEKGFQNTADESDVVPDIFTYDKKVAASRASYGGEQGIPFVSKVRQQIETIDDDARMTGAQLLKSFRQNGVRDEALESSGIMYLLEKNKNNPVLTKDELVKAHERFAPKIELEDVPLDEDNLGGLDISYGDVQRLFNSERGTGLSVDYRNYEEVLFTNTNKETGKYLTKDAHHGGRGNIGHARLSTTDVGEYKNVSVVEEMQSDLQSLQMDNLLVKKGAAGFDKKVDSYINEKRKEFGEYLKDLDDAEQLAALSDKGSPTLSKNIPAIRQRINRALDGMDRAQATRDKLKRDYSGLDDRAYMMRVLSDLPLRNTYEDVDDYMMSDLVGDVYELGTKEAIEFAGKNLAERRPVAELARSDADKALNQVSDIVQAKPSSFVSPSTIQRMEDPSADFTPEAKSLIFTEGIFTNFGTQQIPEFKNEAFGILEALRKASPEAREQYLMRIEGDLNLRASLGETETGLQPALPFKDTFDMSKYQADLLIERAFNKGQNGIAFPDHRDIAAQRGADEKSFVRGYKDAPDAALKEALERYPGAKIVEEKLSGTKHPAKILVFGEAKRVEDKPLFVNYAKGGMVYKGIGSMGREVL